MSDFHAFAVELFEGMGAVKARRMFGGAGLYLGDVMFALIDNDTIYLKTDEALATALKAEGAVVWVYEKRPQTTDQTKMTYYSLPLDALDEPSEAVRWGRQAYAVAAALKKPKTKKPAAKKPSGKKPKAKR